jgi:hypothetical protein
LRACRVGSVFCISDRRGGEGPGEWSEPGGSGGSAESSRRYSPGTKEESCRTSGLDRVTVDELDRIRSRMPTPKIFG